MRLKSSYPGKDSLSRNQGYIFSDLKVQMLEFGMELENSFQLLLPLIVKDSEEMEKASMEGKRKGDGGWQI